MKQKKIKARKTDFTYNDLPKNRKDVFFDVLKLHWRTLLVLGLLILVGALPLLIALFLRDNYSLSLVVRVTNGELDATKANNLNLKAHMLASIAIAISLFILIIPICGSLKILRNLVWGDPVFFKEDFISGIKNNYKNLAIISLFVGLMTFLEYYLAFLQADIFAIYIPLGLFVAILVPPMIYVAFQSNIYQSGFFNLLKNGVLMYIKQFPLTIVFDLILLLPLGFSFMHSFLLLKYILLVVVIVIFVPYLMMICLLFHNYVFDKYINSKLYPELVNKGMYKDHNKGGKL